MKLFKNDAKLNMLWGGVHTDDRGSLIELSITCSESEYSNSKSINNNNEVTELKP